MLPGPFALFQTLSRMSGPEGPRFLFEVGGEELSESSAWMVQKSLVRAAGQLAIMFAILPNTIVDNKDTCMTDILSK